MTYQEALINNPNLITVDIDDALKATIADWFNYRHVADNDLFGVYLNRVLNRDYARYKQLLRVQAGHAEYDWLVSNYMEKQTTNVQDVTQTTENAQEQEINGTNQGRQENSGTDKVTTTGSDNETKELTDTTSYAGSETNTRTGSETDSATHEKGATSSTQKTKNNQQHTSKTSGNPQTLTNHFTGSSAAAKAGPMDAGVAAQGEVTLPGTMGTIPGISVEFNSHATNIQQSQTDDKELTQDTLDSTTVDSYGGDADTVVTTGDAAKDADNATKTYNNVTDTHGFSEDRQDKTTHTGTDNHVTSDKQETEHGAIVDTTGSNHSTNTSNGTQKMSSNNSTVNRERFAGRTEAPADLLVRAVSFIESTNAWEWLMPRIETCFICIYDI